MQSLRKVVHGVPPARRTSIQRAGNHWRGQFRAMASPCEVLVETRDSSVAGEIVDSVARIAWEVENKFSRYRDDNIVHRINNAGGQTVTVDDETARLLDFATTLYELSGGRFDITSGVLRRVWTFDGRDRVPTAAQVRDVMPLVGWDKISWKTPQLTLLPGMQIDFGGIGKEYAVDRCAAYCLEHTDSSCLINFGGDLAISRPRVDGLPWRVGVEAASESQVDAGLIDIVSGGMATSGDSRRFLMRDGVRYSHILDPTSGWPVAGAPHSVTVVAENCVQAGMLATLASLQGPYAESFLDAQAVYYRIQR